MIIYYLLTIGFLTMSQIAVILVYQSRDDILFYITLHYFLFCAILSFYTILFCSILFSIQFYCILVYSTVYIFLFYSILFYSDLFSIHIILFKNSILDHSIQICSV